jgi:hypothetical protein
MSGHGIEYNSKASVITMGYCEDQFSDIACDCTDSIWALI